MIAKLVCNQDNQTVWCKDIDEEEILDMSRFLEEANFALGAELEIGNAPTGTGQYSLIVTEPDWEDWHVWDSVECFWAE